MKTPKQTDHDLALAGARAGIELLTKRVPKTVMDGGSLMAVGYKAAAVSALKVAANNKASLPKLKEALAKLETACGTTVGHIRSGA